MPARRLHWGTFWEDRSGSRLLGSCLSPINPESGAGVGALTVSPSNLRPRGLWFLSRRAFRSPRSLNDNQITDITPLAEALKLNSTVTEIL